MDHITDAGFEVYKSYVSYKSGIPTKSRYVFGEITRSLYVFTNLIEQHDTFLDQSEGQVYVYSSRSYAQE